MPYKDITRLLEVAFANTHSDLAKARVAARQAQTRARQAGRDDLEADADYVLGVVAYSDADAAAALTHAHHALTLARASDRLVTAARAEHLVAMLCFDAGDIPAALTHALSALTVYRRSDHLVDEGKLVSFIATLYALTRQYDLALETYEAALAISEPLGVHDAVVTTLCGLSMLLWRQGRTAEAERRIVRAVDIARGHVPAHTPLCLGHLALFRTELGDTTGGVALFAEAFDQLAGVSAAGAVPVAGHHARLLVLCALAAHRRGELGGAVAAGERAASAAAELGLTEVRLEAHEVCAIAYKQLGDFELALAHVEQAQEIRNATFDTATGLRATTLQITHQTAKANARIAQLEQYIVHLEGQLASSGVAVADPARIEQILERIATVCECRTGRSPRHVRAIAEIAADVGAALGMDDNQCHQLRDAARLHDIGRIATSDDSAAQSRAWDEIDPRVGQHATVGESILAMMPTPTLSLAASIARSHHEHWDGTGLPDGLAGTEIPLGARIVRVADAYESLTGDHGGPVVDERTALEAMRARRGTFFDPEVFDVFEALLHQRRPHLDGITGRQPA